MYMHDARRDGEIGAQGVRLEKRAGCRAVPDDDDEELG